MDYIIITVAVLIIINTYASIRLWKKEEFSNIQKIYQSAIIWILPLLGALFILIFIKEDETPKGPDNPEDGQGASSIV